jgi:hypothetical protein
MRLRSLCLGVLFILIVLCVAACGGSGKSSTPTKTVADPDAGARPNPAGGKGG